MSLIWVQVGRPRYMPVLRYKRFNNARYKHAKHELPMRADAVAAKQLCKKFIGLWKEVRALKYRYIISFYHRGCC